MAKIENGKMRNGIMNREGHWYAVIKVNGRQIKKAAPNKEAAQMLLGQMREDAARGRVNLPKVQRDTLADFQSKYMKWAKDSKDSWKRDELSLRSLIPALGHLRLAELTIAKVEEYMRTRRKDESRASTQTRKAFERAREGGSVSKNAEPPKVKTISPSTVNREVACLRGLLNYAVKIGELEKNPISGISLYKEENDRLPKLEQDEEIRLMDALPVWMRFMYRLAVTTGCRQGELLALRWRNIDLDRGILTVEKSKSGEGRQIPLHPTLVKELTARRALPDGFVITKDDGEPPKPLSVSQAFRRAARQIGRLDLRWHDTRHLAGSRLLQTGASLPEVAATLGHKTLAMSKRYSHVSPVRLATLIAAMPTPAEPAPALEPDEAVAGGAA